MDVKFNKGFTLIEVLVSMLLLTVVLLTVVQTMATYVRYNINNLVRDEAVKIAQSCLENLRNGVDCESNTTKNFRNFSLTFNTTVIIFPNATSMTSGNNQVQIIVTYKYPPNSNSTKTYTINTVIYKP